MHFPEEKKSPPPLTSSDFHRFLSMYIAAISKLHIRNFYIDNINRLNDLKFAKLYDMNFNFGDEIKHNLFRSDRKVIESRKLNQMLNMRNFKFTIVYEMQ